MYKIEETVYGFKLTFSGFITKAELKDWAKEAGEVVRKQKKGFGVLVDMRGMAAFPADARQYYVRNAEKCKEAGMTRSAHILDDPVIALQFSRICKEVGIFQDTRMIDANSVQNCEAVATNWLAKGIDPNG